MDRFAIFTLLLRNSSKFRVKDKEIGMCFKRSELYQYLQSLGLTESEDVRQDFVLVQELPEKQPPWQIKYKYVFQTYIWRHVKNFFGLWKNDQDKILFCREAVENILKSELMMREDSYHVEFIFSKTTVPTQNNRKNGTVWSRAKNGDLLHNIMPVLYSSLRDTVLCTVQYLHNSTKYMLTDVPVMFNIDNVNLYLCSSQWSEIELSDLQSTTGISELQKLKSLYQFIQSEFFRRLALIFCPEVWCGMTSDVQQKVWLLLEDIQWHFGKETLALLKCYSLYNGYKPWDIACDNMESLALDWQFFDSYNVFHNALQHLKEAIITALNIRENVLSTCFLKGNLLEEETKTIVPHVVTEMSEMILHLNNCNSCLKSSINKLNYLNKDNKDTDVKESFSIKNDCENRETDVKAAEIGFSDLDPKGDYEIFEENITSNKKDNDSDNSDYFAELLEETKHKLTKKFHKMVYSELQTALKSKVEEIKIREAEALERKKKTNHIAESQEDNNKPSLLSSNSLSSHLVEGIDSIEACRSNSSIEETFSVLPMAAELPNSLELHKLCENFQSNKYNNEEEEEKEAECTLETPFNSSVSFGMAGIAAEAANIAQSMIVNRQYQDKNNIFITPLSEETITSEETFCYTPEEYSD